jgi:hypothetical protein
MRNNERQASRADMKSAHEQKGDERSFKRFSSQYAAFADTRLHSRMNGRANASMHRTSVQIHELDEAGE